MEEKMGRNGIVMMGGFRIKWLTWLLCI